MKQEKLMQYFRFFTDSWKFFRKYSSPQNEDVFWRQLVEDGNELSRKYGESDFVCKIVGTILQEVERICEEGKK